MHYETGKATHELILRTCRRLFYTKGYDNTTYEDISRTAHLNRNSICYHFKTKSAIRDIIAREVIDRSIIDALKYCETRDYLAMTSSAIFWYRFLKDENYRNFSMYMADLATAFTDLSLKKDSSYFQFLCDCFDTGDEATLKYTNIDSMTFHMISGLDATMMLYLSKYPDRYSYKEATKSECEIVASILKVSDQLFDSAWNEAEKLMERIPFDELDTTLG